VSRRIVTEAEQQQFASLYVLHGSNAAAAYREMGIGESNAAERSKVWLNIPGMVARIERVRRMAIKQLDVSLDRILRELACVAFLDVKDLLAEDGTLLDLSSMTEEARRAIAGIDVEQGQASTVKKIKVSDKLRALEQIAKMQGYLKDKVDVNHTVSLVELLDPDLQPVKDVDATVVEQEMFS
jgi:phage terminase small subunit